MIEHSRRVTLNVSINGHDVASHLTPYLKEFTFTDNAHGKADEVRLVLHNRDGNWSGPWKPRKGMPVTASLTCHDWEASGQELSLPCGGFKIDEVEFSGPPDTVTIKAVSSALTTGLRDTENTRAWENTSLQTVAGEIAGKNGLELMYFGDAHAFKRQDQRKESDLAFVFRLADERAMNCKVHDGKLILFDAEQAEGQGSMLSISRTGNMYSPKSYSFKDSSSATQYSDAEVRYTDPKEGKTHTATAQAMPSETGGSAPDKKTLTLDQRAESAGEAMRFGRAQLHNQNAQEQTASVECMGCPYMVAGRTIDLLDFGKFGGKYFIKTATHSLGGSQGYKTTLELTKGAATINGTASDVI